MRTSSLGMLILNTRADQVWRETFRQPGGGRCDLLRFARDMELCCQNMPKRFAHSQLEFEERFRELRCVHFEADEPEAEAWDRRRT